MQAKEGAEPSPCVCPAMAVRFIPGADADVQLDKAGPDAEP